MTIKELVKRLDPEIPFVVIHDGMWCDYFYDSVESEEEMPEWIGEIKFIYFTVNVNETFIKGEEYDGCIIIWV